MKLRRLIGPLLLISGLAVLFIPYLLEPVLHFLFPRAGEWVFAREPLIVLTAEHLGLSLAAAAAAGVLGIGLGIAATRPSGRAFLPLVRDVAALAQTIPPAAVLALAIPFLN